LIETCQSRIQSLDAIRGVAVLGIFVINIVGFGLGENGFGNPLLVGGDGMLNHGLWTASNLLVEGSMRGLFSLLFGASIVLFTSRAQYPDGPIRVADLYYRRNLWLIVFGLMHSYFLLAPGDILLIYGIAALFLFPFRILSPKWLLVLATGILVLLVSTTLLDELEESRLGQESARVEQRLAAGEAVSETEQVLHKEWQHRVDERWPTEAELQAEIGLRTGDLATVYSSNAEWVAANSQFFGMVWWTLDAVMTMFIGMALFKLGVLTGERDHRFYLRLTVIAYSIGLGFRIWALSTRWSHDFSLMLWGWSSFDQIGRIAMTLGHIGLFFLLWGKLASTRLGHVLTAAGRMALSNYVLQTLIANLIFTSLGLGLFGVMDFTGIYLTMLAIWIAQLLFSSWWLSNFRQGPLEWLWRLLTYGARAKI
jgi:uncharacterized protein